MENYSLGVAPKAAPVIGSLLSLYFLSNGLSEPQMPGDPPAPRQPLQIGEQLHGHPHLNPLAGGRWLIGPWPSWFASKGHPPR